MNRCPRIGNKGTSADQFVSESYRARTAGSDGKSRFGDSFAKLLRSADRRWPLQDAIWFVKCGEGFASAGIDYSQPRSVNRDAFAVAFRTVRSAHCKREGIEAGKADRIHTRTKGQTTGGGDTDPDTGKCARPHSDGDPVNLVPAAKCLRRFFDGAKQLLTVLGSAAFAGPQGEAEGQLNSVMGPDHGVVSGCVKGNQLHE